MARVLHPGGVVALQTYVGLDEQPAYGRFVETVVENAGQDARTLLGTYWSKGDFSELQSLLEGTGLEPSRTESILGHARFPSLDAFAYTEIPRVLREYGQPDAMVSLPIRGRFIAGSKSELHT
jgi:hypothetical protein